MKRILFLSVLALFMARTSSAQTDRAMSLSLNFNPTFNWLNVSGNDAEKSKVGMGFDYGINADFFINHNDRYAITTGLTISNINSKVNYKPDHAASINVAKFAENSSFSVDYRLKYIEVPVAFRLRTKQFDRFTGWGQFGLFTGWNFSAKASTSDNQLDDTNINKDVRLFNMGMNVGVGCEYDLGESNAVSLGLVYKNGFMNVMKHDLGDKSTIKGLVLQVGFLF
ncbi:MAG: porin family protein [Mangrovibacterium sp.]